jgi:hypothetical protein
MKATLFSKRDISLYPPDMKGLIPLPGTLEI